MARRDWNPGIKLHTYIREPLETVRERGTVRRVTSDRACDVCGCAIPQGTACLVSKAEYRAYRTMADIGCTTLIFRFCNSCHPVTSRTP